MIYPIFLSHSSHDKELAEAIKEELDKELGANSVFVSERIGSGEIWFSKVHENLKQCKIMVILLTKPASDSLWVGFEAGFVWDSLQSQERIHILRHPNVKALPSPIDRIHAKYVTDSTHLQEFLQKLCEQFGKQKFESKANIYRITSLAQSIIPLSPERSLAKLEEYIQDFENWFHIPDNGNDYWIYKDDMLYQIELDLNDYDDSLSLPSIWQKKLPILDTRTSKTKVRLKIAGITVYITYFMGIDEGRYFFPSPHPTLDKSIYYLEKNSLQFQIGHIISSFARMHPKINDIYSLCNELGIEIR